MPEKFGMVSSAGRLGSRQKSWRTLHLADGRQLNKHPAFVEIEYLLRGGNSRDEGSISWGDANRAQVDIPKFLIALLEGAVDIQEVVALLREGNEELKESAKEIEKQWNAVTTVGDATKLKLHEYLKEIRDTRMSAVVELKQLLAELDAIRSFFSGQDFGQEMHQVERFISASNELKRIKDSGVFDAMLDAILKLEEKNERQSPTPSPR